MTVYFGIPLIISLLDFQKTFSMDAGSMEVKLCLIIFRCLLILILLCTAVLCIIFEKGPQQLWTLIIGNCLGYTFSSRLKKISGNATSNLDEIDGNKKEKGIKLFIFIFSDP